MFYLSYYAHIPTSDILRLSTYEFRLYIHELNETRKKEQEEKKEVISSFYKLIAKKKGGL